MTDLRKAAAYTKPGAIVPVNVQTTQLLVDALRQALAKPDEVLAEREKVAQWMIERSYATGHGDTIKDLLAELEWQVAEQEREACAKVADAYADNIGPIEYDCGASIATSIRARSEK